MVVFVSFGFHFLVLTTYDQYEKQSQMRSCLAVFSFETLLLKSIVLYVKAIVKKFLHKALKKMLLYNSEITF